MRVVQAKSVLLTFAESILLRRLNLTQSHVIVGIYCNCKRACFVRECIVFLFLTKIHHVVKKNIIYLKREKKACYTMSIAKSDTDRVCNSKV